MLSCPSKLWGDLTLLALGYHLTISEDFKWLIVHNFKLPPGYNCSSTEILLEIPQDYPCSPLGVGDNHVYIHPKLRFKGKKLTDLHEGVTPGWGNWAWFCYSSIEWDPNKDDLIRFMEIVRTDLTNPKTE